MGLAGGELEEAGAVAGGSAEGAVMAGEATVAEEAGGRARAEGWP